MSDKTELRMNLAAVKRVDPYAKDIVDSSAHVAFYTFNSEENEWEKTDVEGVFFIYSRNAEPLHSIFINNRLNTNSFIEPITGQLELQSQPPFLLYRNERSRIRGFWFYNSSECDRIGELVGRLIKECEVSKLSSSGGGSVTTIKNHVHEVQQPRGSGERPNANNIDIFTMLSKAQQDFNNSQNPSRMPSTAPMAPVTTAVSNTAPTIINNTNHHQQQQPQQQPDVTSQSVMNFFAAAKPAAASEVPLFQRLMSKPVPVDQIEKQQRATTPQDGRMSPVSTIHHNLVNLSQQHQQQPMSNNSVSGIESAINLMNLNSPKQPPPPLHNHQDLGTSPLAKFLGGSIITNVGAGAGGGQPRTLSASEIENSQKPLQQLLRKESIGIGLVTQHQQQQLQQPTTPGGGGGTANKPALMPPTMFLSSSVSGSVSVSKAPPVSSSSASLKELSTPVTSVMQTNNNCLQRQQSITNNSIDGGGGGLTLSLSSSSVVNLPRPEPLTQTQLVQAMMYMMQNDPEFVRKLHEAYLKSFTEMVSL